MAHDSPGYGGFFNALYFIGVEKTANICSRAALDASGAFPRSLAISGN